MQDIPYLADYNVAERVDTFFKECMKLFNVTAGNDIMLTMGTDFNYAAAHVRGSTSRLFKLMCIFNCMRSSQSTTPLMHY